MGIGVFFDPEGLTFILDPFEGCEELDPDLSYFMWGDFIDTFVSALPGKWQPVEGGSWSSSGRCVARSGLHELFIKECDSGNGNVYVTLRIRESVKDDYFSGWANTVNLAAARLHVAANAVARCAENMFGPLRQRSCAWTTSPFTPFDKVGWSVQAL